MKISIRNNPDCLNPNYDQHNFKRYVAHIKLGQGSSAIFKTVHANTHQIIYLQAAALAHRHLGAK